MNPRVRCLNNTSDQRILNSLSDTRFVFALCLLALGMLIPGAVSAQSRTYNASGTFTVPDGVTSITVQAWGGGGGGASGAGRGGGGGGAFATKTFTVTPGTLYTVTVGTGGSAGVGGGSSSFGVDVIAVGGGATNSNTGGTGGAAGACTPVVGAFSGGNGGTSSATGGDNDAGGGGGGAATSSASGRNGANGTSTTPGAGGLAGGGAGSGGGTSGPGDGGDGADDVDNSTAEGGFAPGGGGGARAENTGSTAGSGASGRVTVTWTCSGVDVSNFSTAATTPICTGNTSTVTLTSTTLADGTYTVYYNLSGVNTANAQSASMTFSGTTGTFSTIALANSGATTITITSVGCADTETGNTAAITVNAPPATPGSITGTTPVCSGQTGLSYSISAVSGATSYTWTVPTGWMITAGQGTISITVTSGSADQSGNVSVTATNTCGTSAASSLSVNPIDNIGFNGNTATNTLSICDGTTGTTIDAGPAPSGPAYQWQVSTTSPGSGFANAAGSDNNEDYTIDNDYYDNPGTYYFRRVISSSTSACDGNSDVVTLTVNALPVATISVTENSGTANDGTVCNGTQVTLGVAAASSYLWAPGGATTQTIDVTPAVTTTYTVTVTNAAGCTATDTQVITVNGLPTINSMTASPSSICIGGSSVLTVVPANNSTQSFSNNNLITIPNFGNASPFPSTISVSGLPTSGITVASVSFNNLTLEDPNDADIYLIGPNNQVIWVMSDAGGTTGVSNFDLTYADGGTTLTTGTLVNGTTYDPADLTATETTPGGATLITTMAGFTGNMNGTWSLYIVDDDNDTNSGDLEGWTVTFNTPNYNYTWSNGGPNASTQTVMPVVTTTYTVTVTIPGTGCSSTASTTVTVTSPTAAIAETDNSCAPNDMKVLSGDAATLTASGGVSYLWDGGSTSAARVVNPLATTTYTVTVTDGNGCTDTETATVTVNPLPVASITGTLSFCTGSNTILMAGGGTSYLWDDASTNAMRTITAAGTYTVQVTDGNGCTDTETATVTASTPATADAGGPYSTCGTTPVAISATTSGTGMWSGGLGTFGSAASTSTTYTPAMSELGTTVTLIWTTDDPDGPDACVSVSDMATLAVAGQEINLKGNGVSIVNGDATPVAADHTDFGWTTVASGTISRTFMIENTGTSSLVLTGGTPVTLSGPNAADFTVTMQPASPVATGGSKQFQIEFDPSAAGMRTATVSVASNDCDEAPYTFDITGKGTIPQAISVFGNGNQIANRASSASVSDDTDFGGVSTGGGMASHTFTIKNIANGSPLLLTGVPTVTIADRDAADFTVTAAPTSPVDGGGSTTFTIKFQPGATGLRTAVVIITHNGLPENPFVFTINGTGL